MDKKIIIKTESLEKVYNSSTPKNIVLKNINLEINEGEFTIIMGNSGSGKSTLLYLLSGLDKPTSGSIMFREKSIHNLKEKALAKIRRKDIGFVFQEHNLVSELSIIENILIAGYLTKKKRKLVQEKAQLLMNKLEIAQLANRMPSEVSGGERQRCSIARGLINNPMILMADEPTGNLNSSASEKVLNSFKEINKEGQSILMVTHDIKSACYGDRVIFLKDGQIVDNFFFNKEEELAIRQNNLLTWLQNLGW